MCFPQDHVIPNTNHKPQVADNIYIQLIFIYKGTLESLAIILWRGSMHFNDNEEMECHYNRV